METLKQHKNNYTGGSLGAPGGNRTPTSLRTTDFESVASTSSATEALWTLISTLFLKQNQSLWEIFNLLSTLSLFVPLDI